MNIKNWAEGKCEESKKTIRQYITDGWDKDEAIEKVLNASVLGSGYKAQIRYEFKKEVQS